MTDIKIPDFLPANSAEAYRCGWIARDAVVQADASVDAILAQPEPQLVKITNEQKLALLLKVLKQYAEKKHCYNMYGDDYNPNDYTHGDAAFDDGSVYGEITFARTLLEQIGVEYENPVMKEND